MVWVEKGNTANCNSSIDWLFNPILDKKLYPFQLVSGVGRYERIQNRVYIAPFFIYYSDARVSTNDNVRYMAR